eukprot:5284250-Amphidinium_carterae.1
MKLMPKLNPILVEHPHITRFVYFLGLPECYSLSLAVCHLRLVPNVVIGGKEASPKRLDFDSKGALLSLVQALGELCAGANL